MVSYAHAICAKGFYVAIISAMVETDNPQEEIGPAVEMLGTILEMFVSVSDIFSPLEDGKESNLWITKSYDPSSHMEIASDDIL